MNLKIITWNCNGAFRKKFSLLNEYNADVIVIQECENPLLSKNQEYINWAKNYFWIGDNKNKGVGVFAKENIKLDKLDWSDVYSEHRIKYFLPLRINDKFNIIAVWAHKNNSPTFGYIGQLWKYLQINKEKLDNKSIVVGDLNSNKIWDKWDRWWNHSDVIKELKEADIYSTYHSYFNELQGEESQPTFFLQRKLTKPYHIDFLFAGSYLNNKLKEVTLGKPEIWLKSSDHIPILVEFNNL
ncbi:endonuclease/exonuclease/phosphatase family protein [Mesoflavibacter zeaxanthinifaciens]|uniref:endonuclease/exonuclease/phosphatase family protein n=1 Tax=Mesoflavibacter zeaxanthinifaciens TaxID=393060 RepID=UPI003A908813